MILISFSGFLRISEALALRSSDISFKPNHLELFIRSSKTDEYRQGNVVVIKKTGKVTCPFTTLQTYFELAKIKTNSEEFIFRSVVKTVGGERLKLQRLSYTRFREALLTLLKSIGLNPIEFGTHSLRSGGASRAAEQGMSHEQIKCHGRWKSDSAKNRYIEQDVFSRLAVSSSLDL